MFLVETIKYGFSEYRLIDEYKTFSLTKFLNIKKLENINNCEIIISNVSILRYSVIPKLPNKHSKK